MEAWWRAERISDLRAGAEVDGEEHATVSAASSTSGLWACGTREEGDAERLGAPAVPGLGKVEGLFFKLLLLCILCFRENEVKFSVHRVRSVNIAQI